MRDKLVSKYLVAIGLTAVNGSLETVRGRIATAWTLDAQGHFDLTVTIPPNVEATVQLPTGAPPVVVGSGVHVFHCTLDVPASGETVTDEPGNPPK